MQRRGLMESRRGLSDVITSVLLILLVLAGIAIMWVVIRQFISGATSQLDENVVTTSFVIMPGVIAENINGKINELKFNVRREATTGDPASVSALNVIVKDSTGAAITKRYDVIGANFPPLSTQTVSLSGLEGLSGKIASVQVVPVIRGSDGKETIAAASPEQIIQVSDQLYVPNLIAHYSFDESVSWVKDQPQVVDKISGITGTPGAGAAQETSSSISGRGSAKFDGRSTAYITIPAPAANEKLDLPAKSNSLTIMVWIKPEDDASQTILSSTGGSTGYHFVINSQFVYASGVSSFNKLPGNLMSYVETAWKPSEPGLFKENQWTHVAITISPSDQKFFVNGVEKKILTGQAISSSVDILSTNTIRRIGSYQNNVCAVGSGCRAGSTNAEFKGQMDELMISDKALDKSIIEGVYAYYNAHRTTNN